MKTTALFFALSLSIISAGCGVEGDPTGSGPAEMNPKDSRDSRAPSMGEKSWMVVTVCKTELTFLDDPKSTMMIDRVDSWNKNDKAVNVSIFDDATNKVLNENTYPSGWKSTDWVQIEKGKTLRFESSMQGFDSRIPCEIIRATMP